MTGFNERRNEARLRYHWPVWFTQEHHDDVDQGQMVDVSSVAAAFTCPNTYQGPYPYQQIKTRFSIPLIGPDDSFEMRDFIRDATVKRVEQISHNLHRVVVAFHEPLPVRPGEQETHEVEMMAV